MLKKPYGQHSESEKGQNSWKQNWSKPEPVTMKMIDFAHSTFEGFMDDPVIHEGPDSGYIKGLDSLMSIIQNAQENHKHFYQSMD